MSDKASQHHWSGWPGAFCLKCGGEDPAETALADGLWEADQDKKPGDEGAIIWRGTPEQKAALEAAEICPVKGTLEWDKEAGKWKLVPP